MFLQFISHNLSVPRLHLTCMCETLYRWVISQGRQKSPFEPWCASQRLCSMFNVHLCHKQLAVPFCHDWCYLQVFSSWVRVKMEHEIDRWIGAASAGIQSILSWSQWSNTPSWKAESSFTGHSMLPLSPMVINFEEWLKEQDHGCKWLKYVSSALRLGAYLEIGWEPQLFGRILEYNSSFALRGVSWHSSGTCFGCPWTSPLGGGPEVDPGHDGVLWLPAGLGVTQNTPGRTGRSVWGEGCLTNFTFGNSTLMSYVEWHSHGDVTKSNI